MRGASRGAEDRTWARGHSKTRSNSKRKRQDAQADDEDITRTRYEVTSRRGGQRERPNGRPCAFFGKHEVLIPRRWTST